MNILSLNKIDTFVVMYDGYKFCLLAATTEAKNSAQSHYIGFKVYSL